MSKLRIYGDTSGYVDIAVPETAGTRTLNLDKVPQADLSGNTGIGTDTPASKLHVHDGDVTITSPSGTGGRYLTLDNTDTGGRQYAMISTNNSHGSLGGGNFAILDVDLGGNDANQTRLLINSSGNVGIGITNPGELLHLQLPAATNGDMIRLSRAAGAYSFQLGVTDASNFYLSDNSDNKLLEVTYTGATNFRSTLDNSLRIIKTTGTSWNYIDFYSDAANQSSRTAYVGTDNNSNLQLFVENGNDVLMAGTGKVGIGNTYSPAEVLDVSGTSTTYVRAVTTGTGTSAGHKTSAGTNNEWVWYSTQGETSHKLYSYHTSTTTTLIDVEHTGKITLKSNNTISSQRHPGFIHGMRQPNVMDWSENISTTAGTQISGFTNKYGVSFTINGGGSTNRNRWFYEDDHFGTRSIVWRGESNDPANSTGQGGYDSGQFYVDDNYAYLFINFVKRISGTATGTYYFGTSGGNINYNNGTTESNPYFSIVNTSSLAKDDWHVDYQVVQSQNDAHATGIHNNGLYRMRDGTRIQAGVQGTTDAAFKMQGNGYLTFRTYLYYATANDGTSLSFGQPYVFKCDGTQPSLSEVFKLFEVAA